MFVCCWQSVGRRAIESEAAVSLPCETAAKHMIRAIAKSWDIGAAVGSVGKLLTWPAGGCFRAKMDFPPTYPLYPPKLKFETPIFHPNSTQHFPLTDGCILIHAQSTPPAKFASQSSILQKTINTDTKRLVSAGHLYSHLRPSSFPLSACSAARTTSRLQISTLEDCGGKTGKSSRRK